MPWPGLCHKILWVTSAGTRNDPGLVPVLARWAALIRSPDGHEDWRRHHPQGLWRAVEHLGGWARELGL